MYDDVGYDEFGEKGEAIGRVEERQRRKTGEEHIAIDVDRVSGAGVEVCLAPP